MAGATATEFAGYAGREERGITQIGVVVADERAVTVVLAGAGVNVTSMDTRTTSGGEIGEIKMTVEVSDLGHLSQVLDQLSQLRNVIEARRVG